MSTGSRRLAGAVQAAWLLRSQRVRRSRPSAMRCATGSVWVCTGDALVVMVSAMRASWHEAQQVVDRVRLGGWFVSAYAIYAGKAQRHARLVPCRTRDAVEGHFEHELLLDLAHRAEAVGRVVAHPFVEPAQLLVGEPEIGLADRRQLARARAVFPPGAERVVGIEGAALSVAALGIHHHAVGQHRVALPLEPGA